MPLSIFLSVGTRLPRDRFGKGQEFRQRPRWRSPPTYGWRHPELLADRRELTAALLLYSPREPAAGNSRNGSLWSLVRESGTFFLLATLAAVALRLVFYLKFPHVTGDSLIYGDIAKNWLDHGIYGLTHDAGVRAYLDTATRLPGFPRGMFCPVRSRTLQRRAAGADRRRCGDLLLRRRSCPAGRVRRAARCAFLLAAVCPFTANYSVAPLTETLSIFFVAAALDAAVAGFRSVDDGQSSWSAWAWCGVALSCGILLRPDGGILLIALGLYLLWRMWRQPGARTRLFWAGALGAGNLDCAAGAVDDPQLAGLPSLHAAGTAVGQRSR